jgi:hypothetical protein
MDSTNPNDKKGLEEILKLLQQQKKATKELYAETSMYGKIMGQAQETINKINQSYGIQTSLVNSINQTVAKIVKKKEENKSLSREEVASLNIAEKIQQSQLDIIQDRIATTAELARMHTSIQTGLQGEYAVQAMQLKAAKDLGNITEAEYKRGLNQLKKDQKQTEELIRQRDLYKDVEKLNERIKKVKDILADPKLAKTIIATEGIKKVIDGMKALRQEFDKFREQGQTITQSLGGTIDTITLKSVLFGFKTGDALRAAQAELGDLSAASGEAADDMAALAATTGASAGAAGKLQASLQQLPGETKKSSVETAQFAGNLARAANVAPGKVLETMAESSEEIAKFSADGGQNFARAAVGAAKMGVEVGKIAAAAENLLDFENSINKQMEASVLLGREINFDKARELAIQGDLMGATQNMLSQLGGEAEFNKMNLVQKKALADSMGMSVADMGKLVKNQGKFNEAQKEALANGESLDSVLAKGGGFLDRWGAPLKDFAIGVLQAIPSLLLYNSNLALVTAQKNANAIATGQETVAENTGIVSRLKSIALSARQTVVEAARRVGRLLGIGVATTETVVENTSTATKGRGLIATLALNAATLTRNVIVGAGNVVMGIANGLLALFGINTAAAGTASAAATPGLVGLAGGLLALGEALGAPTPAGVPVIVLIMGLGLAMMMMGAGVALAMAPIVAIAYIIGQVLMKALEMLPAIINAVVEGFVKVFTVMAANWKILIPVGIGLGVIAMGLYALGTAGMVAFPGLMLAALAMAALAIPMVMVGAAFQYISNSAAGLAAVGAALKEIGVGLGSMTAEGFKALPVISALVALAAVAPALSGLADALGGGGGEEGDKMDVVVQKLDQLISVVSTPAAVTLDGRKVGDAIRLNVNGTAVR